MRVGWEYQIVRVEEDDLEAVANRDGANGWRVSSVTPYRGWVANPTVETQEFMLVLEREISYDVG